MIKVEPYKPKPMIKDKTVPTRRFPFLSTRNSTIGFLKLVSLQIKKNNPKKAATARYTITLLLNQSSSCPFSNTYCNEPTVSANRPIPNQSISLPVLFSPYLGLPRGGVTAPGRGRFGAIGFAGYRFYFTFFCFYTAAISHGATLVA